MKKRNWDINDLIVIVRKVAKDELLPLFGEVKNKKKTDGSLLTEADIAVQNSIKAYLSQLDAEILFLSEEIPTEEQNSLLSQSNTPVWILDPLDGTTNFSSGIPYYSISLALLINDQIELGLVYDPERDECFFAEKGRGAKLQLGNQPAAPVKTSSKVTALTNAVACVDLKRLPKELAIKIVTQHPFRSQRSFGSVALDWCWLAAGRFDVYLHGKQNIWDYAAGHLIFAESGGFSSTMTGEAVFIKRLEARTAVAAGNAGLFAQWANWLTAQ